CGDSVAAARPPTRSSLRLRATWITRARSTWRSPTGGLERARTTAAASWGSTSRRSQARTSRTSGRLRKAAPAPSAAVDPVEGGAAILGEDTSQGYAGAAGAHGYALKVDTIDWGTAQRIGELIGGSPPYGGLRAETIEPRAHEFASRVSSYSELPLTAELPPLEMVDRPTWIAANLQTMRPLLTPLSEKLGEQRGAFGGALGSVSGLMLGAQVAADLAESRPGGVEPRRRPRRARPVGDDPRDHPRRPVHGRALVARAHRRDAQRAARGAPGLARGQRRPQPRVLAPQAAEHGRAAGHGRPCPQRAAAAAHARRGPLAAGRADAVGDVADRGTRRAHDGRRRRRGAPVATAHARRDDEAQDAERAALAGAREAARARAEDAPVRDRTALLRRGGRGRRALAARPRLVRPGGASARRGARAAGPLERPDRPPGGLSAGRQKHLSAGSGAPGGSPSIAHTFVLTGSRESSVTTVTPPNARSMCHKVRLGKARGYRPFTEW